MKTRFLPLSSLLLTFLTLFTMHTVSAQVPSYVPTNGLVGYWPFNGNANDESGNGINLSPQGTASLAVDRFNSVNSAFYFGVTNEPSSLNFPNQANQLINNFSQGTICMWINIQEFSVSNHYFGFDNAFFAKQKDGVNTQLYCGILGGTQKFRFHLNGPLPSGNVFTSNTDIQLNTWTNVTVTWDGITQKIFLNGSEDNSIQSSNYLTDLPDATYINVGACGGIGSLASLSSIDDIGIWNRALTADEVLALYNGCNVTPIAIAGSNAPGAFSTSTYTCDNTAGSTYNWTVTNGVIVSGQGTNSVSILWGAEGVGSVSAFETTADGCVGDAVIYDVNVQCVVSGNAIEGPVGPEAFSNSTYTCNGAANSTYTWTVTNGVVVSGQGTSSVTVLWASTGIGSVSVIETTAEGCVGTELTQDVVVVPVNVEEFSSSFSLFPNPATTELNLQTTNDLIGSDLIIFDALGKQIHKQQILSTNTRINSTAFAAGNYVVKVGGVVKRVEVKK